jgi:hypothetical protein
LVENPEGKRSLGRPRPGWKDNIKQTSENYDGVMDWTHLAQRRNEWRALVNTVINLRVP